MEIGYQGIRKGDLVIHQMDAFAGAVGVSDSDGKGTPVYSVCRPTGNANPFYFAHVIREMARRRWIAALAKGIRERSTDFRYAEFARQVLPLPPVDEQNAIVRYLEYVDRRVRRYVRAKERLIGLLEEEKQAVINQAVTRGLDSSVRLKASGVEWLGDVPEHWEVRRLKQVSVVETGVTLGKSYGDRDLLERPYLRVANVQSGRLDLSKVTTVQVPASEIQRSTLRIGDVLMTEGGDIDKLGRGCVWSGEIRDCLHQNHIFAVRTDRRALLPEFLVSVMGSNHARSYFQSTAKKTTNLAATNQAKLGNLPLLLPTIDEQQKILGYLGKKCDLQDLALARSRRQIDLIQEYRTRLIADVVTGKVDVREAAARLPDATEAPDGQSDYDRIGRPHEANNQEVELALP